MLEVLNHFVKQKFLDPLCNYYTLEATITYGLALAVATYLTYRFLKKIRLKVDKMFFVSLLPFIIYGGWTRALRDHNIYEGIIFCSPPIYFFVFFVTFFSLVISIVAQRKYKIKYYIVMSVIGWSLVLYNLTLTQLTNLRALGMIFALISFWGAVFFGISKLFPKILTRINAGIITAHLVDASSSFVSVTFYDYCEQHVLTGTLMGAYCDAGNLPKMLQLPFMPWVIFPLKIVFVWAALHLLDKYAESDQMRDFLKIIILILGLALGIRNMLTVSW